MRTDPSTKALLMNAPHCVTEPNILYFGTPVVLVSTLNEDGTANLAPISSAFWLGWRGVIGIAAARKPPATAAAGACVTEPAAGTGARGGPDRARRAPARCQTASARRAAYEPDKFGRRPGSPKRHRKPSRRARLNARCIWKRSAATHGIGEKRPTCATSACSSCASSACTCIPTLLMDGHADRIDPDKWSPLIMSFQKFYGLTPHQGACIAARRDSRARVSQPRYRALARRGRMAGAGGSGVERDGKHVGATTAPEPHRCRRTIARRWRRTAGTRSPAGAQSRSDKIRPAMLIGLTEPTECFQ